MKRRLRPYLFISLCGIFAFAPVSFMIRALKNDVVALEYPINQFISQAVRHGEWPLWFNTWGRGFPLQSNLTWGIFSSPQLFFSSVFNYDIYALHIEFMFFILLAGCSMFYLLKRFFLKDEKVAILLSVGYMLSGFMVGSTQWLLYLTAAAFIPLLLTCILSLLEKPDWLRALQLAVIYTMMFTSVYAALNIITTYSILLFLAAYLLQQKDRQLLKKQLFYLFFSGMVIATLCIPVLYFTIEVLQNIERGSGINDGTVFANSNYLHPYALQTLFLPLSAVRMQYPNTEGTMLASYIGMFVLLLTPAMLWRSLRERHARPLVMMGVTILFLFISFGSMGGIRPFLNYLPGFSYFRNPAIFRFYFILSLVLFLAVAIRKRGFASLFAGKTIMYAAVSCCVIYSETIFSHYRELNIHLNTLEELVKSLTENQVLVISSIIQLTIVLLAWLLVYKKQWRLCFLLFAFEIVINTILCTPFFSVSSYTPAQVNAILKIKDDFPVQKDPPSEVKAVYKDERNNEWQNVNIFSKRISSQYSYQGPLVLKRRSSEAPGKQLVYAPLDSTATIQLLLQKPGHVRAKIVTVKQTAITLQQNPFKGWKVYVNYKQTDFTLDFTDSSGNHALPEGRSTIVQAGESIVDFIYKRNDVEIFTIILHLFIFSFVLFRLIHFSRSFFLS